MLHDDVRWRSERIMMLHASSFFFSDDRTEHEWITWTQLYVTVPRPPFDRKKLEVRKKEKNSHTHNRKGRRAFYGFGILLGFVWIWHSNDVSTAHHSYTVHLRKLKTSPNGSPNWKEILCLFSTNLDACLAVSRPSSLPHKSLPSHIS